MPLPDEAIGPARTRVLLAVLADQWPTVDSCMRRTGLSRNTVYYHMVALRKDGLIDWDSGRRGTMRALYRPTP